MDQRILQIAVKVYNYDELNSDDTQLIDEAIRATERSYVPYSSFCVGAAVRLSDGTIVSGSNQENAAYPSGMCAERTTLFYANSQYPEQAVDTLAIAARKMRDNLVENPITPCGACRQVMIESEKRAGKPMRILLYGRKGIYEVASAADLLPLSFDADAMN
ncbi:MAG: cytidine deaminase [Prevotellaceae bacterium]|jgi:cytidine deaminase|nr:cytidine deaminase [Prevotellaceae bacterium]